MWSERWSGTVGIIKAVVRTLVKLIKGPLEDFEISDSVTGSLWLLLVDGTGSVDVDSIDGLNSSPLPCPYLLPCNLLMPPSCKFRGSE